MTENHTAKWNEKMTNLIVDDMIINQFDHIFFSKSKPLLFYAWIHSETIWNQKEYWWKSTLMWFGGEKNAGWRMFFLPFFSGWRILCTSRRFRILLSLSKVVCFPSAVAVDVFFSGFYPTYSFSLVKNRLTRPWMFFNVFPTVYGDIQVMIFLAFGLLIACFKR